jgi:hypothetical protein
MSLVVARWGVADPFVGVATDDREITGPDELTGEEDLLLVAGALARDHGRELRRLRRHRDSLAVLVDGTPLRGGPGDLLVGLRSRLPGRATSDGAGDGAITDPGVLDLPPAIDPRRDNPVGWRRWAGYSAAAVLTAVPEPDALGPLLDPALEARLVLGPGVRRGALPDALADHPSVRVEDAAELADRLQRFRVLLDDPRWHADPRDEQAVVLRSLAVGTPVVTGGDVLSRLDVEVEPHHEPDLVARARRLIDDDAHRERVSVVGRRRVLSAHTGAHRLRAVLAALGRPVPAEPRVSVLLATNRPGLLGHAVGSVARQGHPDVELVAILHGDGFDDLAPLERLAGPVRVVRAPAERTLGECLNLGLEEATGELVAKMDDDDHYGRDHLGDLVRAHGYSGAALVGKRIEHVHLADRDLTVTREQANVERFGIHVSGPTLLAARGLLQRYRFLPEPARVDSTLIERLRADDEQVYGTHALDVVLERRGEGHTWEADVEQMLATAAQVSDGLDLARTASEPGAYDA